MSDDNEVLYDVKDRIATVTLNRPDRMNSVNDTLPFNIASRCPVMSVPSGLSRDGVPTGLSIVGRTYDDVTVFRVAAAHEARSSWTWPAVPSVPRPR